MARFPKWQVDSSADPTNLSSLMKFREANQSYAKLQYSKLREALAPPLGCRPPPLGCPSTARRGPQRALHTRRVPPAAARASVAPPEAASQVRTRSTEPHGPDLRPSAGPWRLVRQGAGGHREPNGASTPVGRVLRHRARAPGSLRQPDRCEQRATASHDAVAQGAS